MSLILCDGGVDQQSQRIASNPGRPRDCLNFEVDTERGYKTIQGFARYDGRAYPNLEFSLSKYTFSGITGTFEVGETLTNSDGVRFATFVKIDSTEYVLDVFSTDALPGATGIVTGAASGATATRGAEVADASLTPTTAADWLTLFEDNASEQRSAVEWCGSPVLGVHYFQDAAWVIRDQDIVGYQFQNFPWDGNAGTGRTEIPAGAIVAIWDSPSSSPSLYLAEVVQSVTLSGSYAAGTALQAFVVRNLNEGPLNLTPYSGYGTLNTDPLESASKQIIVNYLWECKFSTGSGVPDFDGESFGSASGTFYVQKITINSGSFAGGDAEGTVWLQSSSTPNVETFTGTTSSATFDVDEVIGGDGQDYYNDPSALGVGNFAYARSQLIKDNGAGWDDVDMGYEVQFDTGGNEPQTVFDLTISQVDPDEAATASDWQTASDCDRLNDGQSNGWRNTAGSLVSTDVAAATDTSGDADYAESTPTGNSRLMKSLILRDFGFALDDDVTIAGVQVEVRLRNQNNDIEWQECRLVTPNDVEGSNKAPDGENLNNTFTTETFGGEGDNWGADLTAERVNSADFGVKLQFYAGNIVTSAKVEIDYFRIRVWTRPATERVYFYDGASDVAEADLVYVQRLTGSWAGGDAGGVATIRNITDGPIVSGLSVYTGASATGDLLFVTASAADPNTLPTLAELDAAESRYRFIDENFYAQSRLRAVYGVSGAGFAFTFNDDYFIRLRTNFENADDDVPRHITRHIDRIMLGYETGEAIFSGAGNPANFEDTAGASDSFGAPITGLVRMTGEATAVLTQKDVQVLQGPDPGTWQKSFVSTESGALNHTAVDVGSPIYCDVRGISSVGATDKYGDFQRGRISFPIEPWIRPRIQRLLSGRSDSKKQVVAVPIRAKSQYLLFFADGYALSMTMMGDDAPQPMFRQYKVDGDALEIIAAGEGTTSGGQDRVFMSHRGSAFLYELNRGLSFDGDPFSIMLEFNATFMDPKHDWTGLRALLHGNVFNEGELNTATITDYDHEVAQDRVILRAPTESYNADELGFLGKIRMKSRGNNIALKLERDDSAVKPGVTIQAYEWTWPRAGKGDR